MNDPVYGEKSLIFEKLSKMKETCNELPRISKETILQNHNANSHSDDDTSLEAKEPLTMEERDFSVCEECIHPRSDPKPENMMIYLHAYKYSGPGWSYETEWPLWAKDRMIN